MGDVPIVKGVCTDVVALSAANASVCGKAFMRTCAPTLAHRKEMGPESAGQQYRSPARAEPLQAYLQRQGYAVQDQRYARRSLSPGIWGAAWRISACFRPQSLQPDPADYPQYRAGNAQKISCIGMQLPGITGSLTLMPAARGPNLAGFLLQARCLNSRMQNKLRNSALSSRTYRKNAEKASIVEPYKRAARAKSLYVRFYALCLFAN